MNFLRRGGFGLAIWTGLAVLHAQALLGPDPAAVEEGRKLARTYCITCHLFPEPDAVDVTTWREQILPRMKYRLGFSTPELERSPNIQLLRAHKRIPDRPVITEEQWLKLADYYFASAPTAPLLPTNAPVIQVGVPGFQFRPLPYRSTNPAVTAVRILPGGGALVSQDTTRQVVRLDRTGAVRTTLQLSNAIASFRVAGDAVIATGIGSFQPSDERTAAVYRLTPGAGGLQLERELFSDLMRSTDALPADLNGDRQTDYVVSSFGNNLGQLAWFEGREGGFTEHELFNLPGAVRAEVRDFDGDGRPDVAALVAQETEALFVFRNAGGGQFTRQTVFQRPPHWGHSHFEVLDFNRDGRADFLVVNGDNGEFNSPVKRIHGLRLWLGQADGSWKQEFFYPQFGAYCAKVGDFDGDGDVDIASISFFVDYTRSPRGSFVLLRNDGAGKLTPFTFAESAFGRWVCLDAGDFDGDGDDDLLLGAYAKGPTAVPAKLMEVWQSADLPVVLLENQRLPAKPAGP